MRKALKLFLCSSLILAIGSSSAHSEDSGGALSGALNILGTAGTVVGGTINGVNQGNQTAASIGQNAAIQQYLTRAGNNSYLTPNIAMTQLSGEMLAAYTAEQACESKASARKASASSSSKSDFDFVTSTPIDCTNYADIHNRAVAWIDQFNMASDRFKCISDMQATLKTLTAKFGSTVNDLVLAGQKGYNAYESVLKVYDDMTKKLDFDLNGKDGSGGYISQLSDLNNKINLLQSVISGGSASNNGDADVTIDGQAVQGNLSQKVSDLTTATNNLANSWMTNLMQQTLQCFTNNPTTCSAPNSGGVGSVLTPYQCLQAEVNNLVGANTTQSGVNSWNQNIISQILNLQQATLNNYKYGASLNTTDVSAFQGFATGQFNSVLAKLASPLSRAQLKGGAASADQLTSFYNAQMTNCFNIAMAQFNSDFASQNTNSPFYGPYYAQASTRAKILSSEQQTLNLITNDMNAFLSNFRKKYDPSLPQFAAGCATAKDPAQGLDCLKEMAANLSAGINGTANSVTLSTGGQFTAAPTPTTINLQTLVPGQNGGPPVAGTFQQACNGYKDCVQQMVNQENSYQSSIITTKNAEKQFVDNIANTTIDNAMKQGSNLFSQFSQAVDKAISDLENTMAGIGIHGIDITTDVIEGEALTKDDKTGLYTNPKDIKKAIAGAGGAIKEINADSKQAAFDAANKARDKVVDKGNESQKFAAKCSVVKKDYDSLKKILGNCTDFGIFCGAGAKNRFQSQMLSILIHGTAQGMPDSSSSNSSSDQNSCISSTISLCNANFAQTNCLANQGNSTSCQDTNIANQNYQADCIKGSSASCLAQTESQYPQRSDALTAARDDIDTAFSTLQENCKTANKPTSTTPEGASTAIYTKPDCKTNLQSDPVCVSAKSACDALTGVITSDVDSNKDIPDKMPDLTKPGASSDSANSGNSACNPAASPGSPNACSGSAK